MSRYRGIGILLILVCVIQALVSAAEKPPENQFTITVTNVKADAKPSILVIKPLKEDKKPEQDVEQNQATNPLGFNEGDEYIAMQDAKSELLGYEPDIPVPENDPFDDNTSSEAEAVVSEGTSVEDDLSANSYHSEETTSQTRAALPQATNCRTQGQVALTYSEGPSDATAKIARQLKKADARANFFVNATWLYTQQYAMVLQNLYNAGHFIGMTYRVPGDNPDALSDEELREDIIQSAHTIEAVIRVSPKYVRLHYTEVKDERTERLLSELGFVIVGYNLDSLDYIKKDATGPNSIQSIYSETFKKYKDTYDAKGSFISIQYDLPYTGSLNAVPYIINTIDEEGYTMVRMDGCLNDATPYKKSANGTEYTSDKFSLNQPDYHQGQNQVVIDETKPIEEQEEEEEEFDAAFKIQNVKNMSSTRTAPFSAILFVIAAIFTLFL